jgi:hypothetical protein
MRPLRLEHHVDAHGRRRDRKAAAAPAETAGGRGL